MSTTTTAADTSHSENAQRLARYLRREAEEASGDLYVKGKFIADDVDLSSKQIGALMVQLQDSVPGLEIEKWSYTAATTWRISASA